MAWGVTGLTAGGSSCFFFILSNSGTKRLINRQAKITPSGYTLHALKTTVMAPQPKPNGNMPHRLTGEVEASVLRKKAPIMTLPARIWNMGLA